MVQVGTVTVRMGPVGFALYAEEFFLAGASIPPHSRARGNTEFTPVPYYLYCRALELILKAFLLAKHQHIGELKKRHGHNLETLWEAAKTHGLKDVLDGEIPPHFEADLRKANAYYKGKVFEYFDFRRWVNGYDRLPPLLRFRDEVHVIVEKTKKHCFSVADQDG